MEERRISLAQLDVLREIGTIGAGRAATALSDMLNTKVEITLPETNLIPLENLDRILGDPERPLFVLDTGFQGEISGRVLFLIPPEDGKILGSILLGKRAEEIKCDDLLFQSCLKEVVNILTGAHMNALSDITGLSILYGVPSLALDMVSALLDFIFIQIAQHSEEAFFIRTDLKVKDINFNTIFLFFPDQLSLKKIFEVLNI
ncbi:MAG: chemotaxis protein CheC [Candidatus Omnitrophica bacterium]|nr:chemotaxis protein CheC [Candidatus Omnitrophota bacterium]